jgi:hypothetical protein
VVPKVEFEEEIPKPTSKKRTLEGNQRYLVQVSGFPEMIGLYFEISL